MKNSTMKSKILAYIISLVLIYLISFILYSFKDNELVYPNPNYIIYTFFSLFVKSKTYEFAAFTILIESLITYINQFFMQGNFCWQMFLSLTFGVVIAVAYKLDLPAHFDLKSEIPYIGCVLTGILLSRGSNYIADLLSKLASL